MEKVSYQQLISRNRDEIGNPELDLLPPLEASKPSGDATVLRPSAPDQDPTGNCLE